MIPGNWSMQELRQKLRYLEDVGISKTSEKLEPGHVSAVWHQNRVTELTRYLDEAQHAIKTSDYSRLSILQEELRERAVVCENAARKKSDPLSGLYADAIGPYRDVESLIGSRQLDHARNSLLKFQQAQVKVRLKIDNNNVSRLWSSFDQAFEIRREIEHRVQNPEP